MTSYYCSSCQRLLATSGEGASVELVQVLGQCCTRIDLDTRLRARGIDWLRCEGIGCDTFGVFVVHNGWYCRPHGLAVRATIEGVARV